MVGGLNIVDVHNIFWLGVEQSRSTLVIIDMLDKLFINTKKNLTSSLNLLVLDHVFSDSYSLGYFFHI